MLNTDVVVMKIWQIVLIAVVMHGIIGAVAGGGDEQPAVKENGGQKEVSATEKKAEKQEENYP